MLVEHHAVDNACVPLVSKSGRLLVVSNRRQWSDGLAC